MNSCVQQSIILFMLFFASTTVVFPMFFRFSSDDNTIIIPLYNFNFVPFAIPNNQKFVHSAEEKLKLKFN